ncbi:MAG: capsular biosynthesis protein [Gammaproteobacteria bacterium]|nr:capsular biosynthesis protein [Gammaproteobacteria bacterium]MDH5729338.1 capsular biosynthesis protein [Gammaproteobacteria bacterium]
MIDLHCHLLAGLDDGPSEISDAIDMARTAIEDGIDCLVCAPHITPGEFENDKKSISQAMSQLRSAIVEHGLPIKLFYGADLRIHDEILSGLQQELLPTINNSRYFLLDCPKCIEDFSSISNILLKCIEKGYVPIIVHPERHKWITEYYPQLLELVDAGAWLQITADSLTGYYGDGAKYWAKRLLTDGYVHVIASGAHSSEKRPPILSEAYERAKKLVGHVEALHLVETRPEAVLNDRAPTTVPMPPALIKLLTLETQQI